MVSPDPAALIHKVPPDARLDPPSYVPAGYSYILAARCGKWEFSRSFPCSPDFMVENAGLIRHLPSTRASIF